MSTATTDHGDPAAPSAELQRLSTPEALRRWSDRCRAAGMEVGLVATMGALHDGHRSLIRRAAQECDRVVVSIFVNPRQFGEGEDLDRYPRSLDYDLAMLQSEGVHAAFVPTVAAMYDPDAATSIRVDDRLTGILEGSFRPGHFDGVALVVTKLFNAARPNRAYFGRKDAQQCAVVRRLAADLDTGVQVVICPVVRDQDGLALSSRNLHLGVGERQRALAIPRGLSAALRAHQNGERRSEVLCAVVREQLEAEGVTVDYVAAVDEQSFTPVERAGVGCEILVAGRMARTRLIDVIRLGIDEPPVPVDPGDHRSRA